MDRSFPLGREKEGSGGGDKVASLTFLSSSVLVGVLRWPLCGMVHNFGMRMDNNDHMALIRVNEKDGETVACFQGNPLDSTSIAWG